MRTELKQRIVGGVVLVMVIVVLLPFFLRSKQPANTVSNENLAVTQGVSFSNNGQKINLTLPADTKNTNQTGNNNGNGVASPDAMNQPNLAVPNANEYSALGAQSVADSSDDIQSRHKQLVHQTMQEDEGLAASAIPLPNDNAQTNDAENNNLQSTLQTELKDRSSPSESDINNMADTSVNSSNTDAKNSTVDTAVNAMPAANVVTKSMTKTQASQMAAPVKSKLEVALTKAAVSSALGSKQTIQTIQTKPAINPSKAAAITQISSVRQTIVTQPPHAVVSAPQQNSNMQARASAPMTANAQSWEIQVGSFTQIRNAENLLTQLRLHGLSAYSQQGYMPSGGQITRVFIGPLSLASAMQVKQQLQSQFHIEGLIKRGNS